MLANAGRWSGRSSSARYQATTAAAAVWSTGRRVARTRPRARLIEVRTWLRAISTITHIGAGPPRLRGRNVPSHERARNGQTAGMTNLARLLSDAVAEHPDRIAVKLDDIALPYSV